MQVDYIIWHCSATPYGTAREIREWHLGRGWSDLGYHCIVLNGFLTHQDRRNNRRVQWLDGNIELGRRWDGDDELEEAEVGAHAYGLNRRSLGLCLIGKNGRFTKKQLEAGLSVTEQWIRQFRVPINGVIGHYEIGTVMPDYATSKTCPDLDMDIIRTALRVRQQIASRATG
jgi:hypothetical protein|tara:strand:+ start:2024 stop:2539 length:516 start_codon:yes stop_codon:yes gene_type:complete